MFRVKNLLTFSHLLYDLFVLSMRITVAMAAATFTMIIPPRAKNFLGETVLVNN